MAKELAFDLICGAGSDDEILELSYATFAEELQVQEILKYSMIASVTVNTEPSSSSSPLASSSSTPEAIPSPSSELSLEGSDEELERGLDESVEEQEDRIAEAFECPVCHKLWCTECTIPQGSGRNCHELRWGDWAELEICEAQGPRLGCNEKQRLSWDEKGRENFMPGRPRRRGPTRHSQSKFNGRRMGDTPQITSRSSESKDIFTADTGKNQDDPKGKGIVIDNDWLMVSKWEPNSRYGRSAAGERWRRQHPSNGSKVINRKLPERNFVKADGVQDVVHEDDSDSLDEDEFDSDTSQKSHETRKKNKWFEEFFQKMDALNIEEIGETLWQCPACKGGPGAIKWYRSILDLIAHSRKVGRRVKVHRELAELLKEELCRKETPITPAAAQVAGKWKGLKEDGRDHEIVWPPMVVIMNTMTSIYTNEKCVGIGSRELLEYFSSYPALKARHSYGPEGHRGLSVLIFESSAVGYLEAEHLHKQFVDQGLDRFAWNSCPDVILPGGERQLYGFMAVKEDLDTFNQHCQGKSKVKYELKSYREAVLNEVKKMNEDSQQLTWLKERLGEEGKRAKTLEESVHNLSRKLEQKMNDIRMFERRAQSLHEQNKEEVDFQENFYKEQIKILEAKVKELEKLQESDANALQAEEPAPDPTCPIDASL